MNSGVEFPDLVGAVQNDNLELLLELHMRMVDITDPGNRLTFLHYACYFGQTEIADYLLKGGAEPNITSGTSSSPVKMAIQQSKYQMIPVLAKHGVDFNQFDMSGYTVIQQAMESGKWKMVRALAEVPTVAINKSGSIPTIYYLVSGMENYGSDDQLMFDLITKHGMEINLSFVHPESISGSTIFQRLMNLNLPMTIEECLTTDRIDVNQKDSKGQTLIMKCAKKNQPKLIEFIWKSGKVKSLEDVDHDDYSAAQLAITYGSIEALQKLVELGAKTEGLLEWTLDLYLKAGKIQYTINATDVIDFLVEHTNQQTLPNKSQGCCSSLIRASYFDLTDVVKMIINGLRETDQLEQVNQVCSSQSSGNQSSDKGHFCTNCNTYHQESDSWYPSSSMKEHQTALYHATSNQNLKLIELLFEAGANPKVGKDPLDSIYYNHRTAPIYSLYIQHGFYGQKRPIHQYPKVMQQEICLVNHLNLNSVQLDTQQPVDKIAREKFILLDNHICWDAESLVKYIIEDRMGENQYPPSDDPVFRGQIWNDQDLTQLETFADPDHPDQTLSQKLKKFLEVRSIVTNISYSTMMSIEHLSEILSGKGDVYEALVMTVLTDDELEQWRSNNIDSSIRDKLKTLKCEELCQLKKSLESGSSEERRAIDLFYKHKITHGSDFMHILDRAIRGDFYLPTLGRQFGELHQIYQDYLIQYPSFVTQIAEASEASRTDSSEASRSDSPSAEPSSEADSAEPSSEADSPSSEADSPSSETDSIDSPPALDRDSDTSSGDDLSAIEELDSSPPVRMESPVVFDRESDLKIEDLLVEEVD